ncbi:MAG: hypothetical protein K9K21_07930 [Desulfotignum sp.]|nr:hypothetical protein [Desulfotignum sp.]MCF8113761.1 hypothetical protein [Desulfotignum sp.]MCF8126451.1 hypothetical protein [Desulfotignum sp.]
MDRYQKKFILKDLNKKLVFLTGPRQVGKTCTLHYLRTKDKAKVDFCIAGSRGPELMIEVKLSDSSPARSLVNFNKRYHTPGIQLVKNLKQEQKAGQ